MRLSVVTPRSLPFNLDDRSLNILERRFRFDPETLESIGLDLGVTRERVRQLQNKAITKLKTSPVYTTAKLAAKRELDKLSYVTIDYCKNRISRNVPSAGEDLCHAVAVLMIKELSCGAEGYLTESVALINARFAKQVLANGKALAARYYLGLDRPIEIIAEEVANEYAKGQDKEWMLALLTDLAPYILCSADEVLLDTSAPSLAKEVLSNAKAPMHWTEITTEVNRIRLRLGKPLLSDTTVHNALIEKEWFSYVDSGVWGLREWGDDVPFIIDVIAAVLSNAEHPLTKGEIQYEANKHRDVKPSSLSLYLDTHPRFYRARTNKYGLRTWLEPNPSLRTPRDFVEDPRSAKRVDSAH